MEEITVRLGGGVTYSKCVCEHQLEWCGRCCTDYRELNEMAKEEAEEELQNQRRGGGRSGYNSQGNHYNSPALQQPGSDSYHYSNQDGSWYYRNSDGSQYHNNGRGSSTYTTPGGHQVRK
ncbi:unnamed protein product [Heterosigma akashiwo]|eukprot:CAMPEP_0206397448 /NCGR_PEP_ID=MMETSP0294-20121207/23475_1 /ASSEMBLY_ACC=CAM_ASM_000327 /TAXON_ID=39354 /ORGANISM="Heterosigma akashiwo, Strain CCMP2393" /LENGTH=119 /DNA_ID=CAMNT_0053852549 /DNA_START=33 /DNA_END=392 /DNA_ORIENTATION=+